MNKIKRTPIKKHKRGKFTGNRSPVTGPLILSKKDPMDDPIDFEKTMGESRKRALRELTKKISSEVGYIETLTQTNLEKTTLYNYQQDWLNDRSKYRHCDKSRQIGQSYVFACEGLSKAQLLNIYTGIFVSYNQDEANEKIVYAKTLYDSIPHKYRKKLVVDRITALEFQGRAPNGTITKTRLISHPQREPRGKGFNTDVYLDEIAHYQWQEKVYVASVPIVTRGLGQLSMASSPETEDRVFEFGNDAIINMLILYILILILKPMILQKNYHMPYLKEKFQEDYLQDLMLVGMKIILK